MAMLCANVNQTLCCVHQIIQGLMHLSAYNTNVVDTIYLMDHYTAGVILFGDRAIVRRQSLPKVICSTIGDGTQDRHHNTHSWTTNLHFHEIVINIFFSCCRSTLKSMWPYYHSSTWTTIIGTCWLVAFLMFVQMFVITSWNKVLITVYPLFFHSTFTQSLERCFNWIHHQRPLSLRTLHTPPRDYSKYSS